MRHKPSGVRCAHWMPAWAASLGRTRDAIGTITGNDCRPSCRIRAAAKRVAPMMEVIQKADLATREMAVELNPTDSDCVTTAACNDASTHRPTVKFTAPPDTFKKRQASGNNGDDDDETAALIVEQVSDTDLRNGAFAALLGENSDKKVEARSVFIEITPPADVELKDGATFTLDFDVSDATIDNDQKCSMAVRKMKVLSASSADASTFKDEGFCAESPVSADLPEAYTCFCRGTLNHFSAYGVVEDETGSTEDLSRPDPGRIRIGGGKIKMGSGRIRFQRNEL